MLQVACSVLRLERCQPAVPHCSAGAPCECYMWQIIQWINFLAFEQIINVLVKLLNERYNIVLIVGNGQDTKIIFKIFHAFFTVLTLNLFFSLALFCK